MLPGDEPTAAGQRLAERAHPDVHRFAGDAIVLTYAMAGFTEDTERMRLVDHEESLVPLLDVDQARQLGNVAVHAVQALHDDEYALEQAADLAQDGIEGDGIVVRKGAPRCARELDPFQDTVMDETVVHHQVLGPEEVADRRYIGRVAADKHHAILNFVERRQRLLELALDGT